MGVLFVYTSVHHICAWCLWSQKRPLDPLEHELEVVLNHHCEFWESHLGSVRVADALIC